VTKRNIVVVVLALSLAIPLSLTDSTILAQEACPEAIGRIIGITGGADVNGDGQGDMWFPFKLPIIAGWAIKVNVENPSAKRQTYRIVIGGIEGTNWRFGYQKHWGTDTSTTLTVNAGKTGTIGNFYVQPKEDNSQARVQVQLLLKRTLQSDCLLASQVITVYTDATAPSSEVYLPATYGQSGYPRAVSLNTQEFQVSWGAQEYQQPASGLKQVTLQFHTKTGAWRNYGVYPANQTSINFKGKFKETYCFRTVAEDFVGNKEPLPQSPNYDTCVQILPPDAPVVVEPPPVHQLLTSAQQSSVPGGVDLIGVCYAYGFSDARNTTNTADGWQCVRADAVWQVNWNRVCRDVYGSSFSGIRIDSSPAGWRCGQHGQLPRSELIFACGVENSGTVNGEKRGTIAISRDVTFTVALASTADVTIVSKPYGTTISVASFSRVGGGSPGVTTPDLFTYNLQAGYSPFAIIIRGTGNYSFTIPCQ
jgi:hypothetical protein